MPGSALPWHATPPRAPPRSRPPPPPAPVPLALVQNARNCDDEWDPQTKVFVMRSFLKYASVEPQYRKALKLAIQREKAFAKRKQAYNKLLKVRVRAETGAWGGGFSSVCVGGGQ